jgi:hypothetical protein
MLQPSGSTHNGLNGPNSGVAANQTNPRHKNVFEGEVLAFDPRTKVLVLSKRYDLYNYFNNFLEFLNYIKPLFRVIVSC